VATLVLFQLFFELDTMDAIYSIIIVNVTRIITAIYLWMVLLQLVVNNPWIAEKAVEQMQQVEMEEGVEAKVHNPQIIEEAREKAKKEVDDVKADPTWDDVPKVPAPKGDEENNDENIDDPAERPPVLRKNFPEMTDALMKFSHRFANLIIMEEFQEAYELTTPEYQKRMSLADFRTKLLDLRNATGIPIGSREHIEAFEGPEIRQRGIVHDVDTPEDDILGITRITFTVDTNADEEDMAQFGIDPEAMLDDAEAILDLLLIKEDGKIRVREVRLGY